MKSGFISYKRILLVWFYYFLIFNLTFFLSGCSSYKNFVKIYEYDCSVDSICDNSLVSPGTKTKCFIFPGIKEIHPEDLQFKEFSSYVKKVLQAAGYSVTSKKTEADIIVLLNYGISDPKTKTISVPIWGSTGISSSTTTYDSWSGTAHTTYDTDFGIVGYRPKYFEEYTRIAVLDAYDLKKKNNGNFKELWKTVITSEGEHGDLREIFPNLMAASIPFIAKNTGRIVNVSITSDSPEVLFIKNPDGMAEPPPLPEPSQ